MDFDIINMTQKEIADMPTIQKKLIRTAQQKKNELEHKMDLQVEEYTKLVKSNGTYNASRQSWDEPPSTPSANPLTGRADKAVSRN